MGVFRCSSANRRCANGCAGALLVFAGVCWCRLWKESQRELSPEAHNTRRVATDQLDYCCFCCVHSRGVVLLLWCCMRHQIRGYIHLRFFSIVHPTTYHTSHTQQTRHLLCCSVLKTKKNRDTGTTRDQFFFPVEHSVVLL